LATIEAELNRQAPPVRASQLKGEKILELAKQAGFLYETQSPAEQRPAVPGGTKLEIGGVDGARTRDLRRDRPAF
jgi:hypothetical protein